MKTTEELAKEQGARISRKSFDGLIKRLEFTVENLEAFSKAIEKQAVDDYFAGVEPSWYMYKAVGTVYRIPLHSGFTASIDNSRVKEFDKLYLAPPNYEALQDKLSLASEAIRAMVEDGWLYHGEEGMDDTQQKVYDAHKILAAIKGE